MCMSYEKKICVVSLLGKQRTMGFAAWREGRLSIPKMEKLGGQFGIWQPSLRERLKEYKANGFSIYIESQEESLADFGRIIQLDMIDKEEGRTYQHIALDKYFSLIGLGDVTGNSRGNLSLNNSIQGSWLTSDNVNVTQDEKGRTKYDINSGAINGERRCMLMCILAATFFNEMDDNYIDIFMQNIGYTPPPTATNRMKNILKVVGGG